MRAAASIIVLAACSSTPERQFCEARERCLDPTDIEAFEATRSADWCEERLGDAVPDGARAALGDCASCLEAASCDAIEGNQCRARCGPVRDAIARPGTVARLGAEASTCTASSLETNASYQSFARFGELALEIDCGRSDLEDGIQDVVILPDEAQLAGDQLPCGLMLAHDSAGTVTDRCEVAAGSITVVSTDGRRSYVGRCACNAIEIDFDVPYRFYGWALTTSF